MLIPTLLLLAQQTSPLAVVDDYIRDEVNVLHYDIAIVLPDQGSHVAGATTIRYMPRRSDESLRLDFDDAFTIDSIVTMAGRLAPETWTADGESLEVRHWGAPGDTLSITIHYQGSPEDGLFIQDNVHGERTAFADNWPNRARHWFPSVDHPSDKATVSYRVEAPAGWKVVANGDLVRVDTLASGRTVWRWLEQRRIPTYTMVIGAGPLTVADIGPVNGVKHQLWTFPQDSAFAHDGPFARANLIVETFAKIFGPFPYSKLAHVESSTRFGGMENSSAIFYTERGYESRRMSEGLVVHETAHQWFGDAVTEYDWHHIWLSEGYATYLAALFYELIDEPERFASSMESSKRSYMQSDDVHRPVIDTTEKSLFGLLNRNSYQKGSLILHMLRMEVDDSVFFGSMREYYETFRDSTATSADLERIVSANAGEDLSWFFEQWLLQPGYPKLTAEWDYGDGILTIDVQQTQQDEWGTYRVNIPVVVETAIGERRTIMIDMRGRSVVQRFTEFGSEPTAVTLDPDGLLLAEVTQSPKRR